MQKIIKPTPKKQETVRFFNFELDFLALKKLLDFHAWTCVVAVALLLFTDFLPRPELSSLLIIFSSMLCVYFFRYTVYLHSAILVILFCQFANALKRFFEISNNLYLIQELANARISNFCEPVQDFIINHIFTWFWAEGEMQKIAERKSLIFFETAHDFIKDFLLSSINNSAWGIITTSGVLYFAYSYQKLKKTKY